MFAVNTAAHKLQLLALKTTSAIIIWKVKNKRQQCLQMILLDVATANFFFGHLVSVLRMGVKKFNVKGVLLKSMKNINVENVEQNFLTLV